MRYTYRAEYVKCGKACCGRCPHGPYWYGYYREGGKLKKRYFGRIDPRVKTAEVPNALDAIFSTRTATLQVAWAILRVRENATLQECKAAYRIRCLEAHPDRGGTEADMRRVNAAWSYLRGRHGW